MQCFKTIKSCQNSRSGFDYIFKEVKNYSNKINAKLYFVYLPAHYPALRNSARKKSEFIYYQKILKLIREHNIG